ncbi:MAG TPA: sugar ABC transporter permease [Paenirhodobacter sp.]
MSGGALTAVIGPIAAVVLVCVMWFRGTGWLLDRVGSGLRPWVFLGPSVVMLVLWLLYPALATVWASVHDADGRGWLGARNYHWVFTDPLARQALCNTVVWAIVVPTTATLIGLFAARITDRLNWGGMARAMMFLPMAISFVGAGVIWKFVYEYRPEDQAQIGLLNALLQVPRPWLMLPGWNTLCLMVVLIWAQAGFATVILSAALRRVPPPVIQAATLDGAGDWARFRRIEVPHISGAISVVWTTLFIVSLKTFDIVFVMTGGQWGTQVLSALVYDLMFRGSADFGRAAAVAVVLMALVVPVMIRTIRIAGQEGR